MLFLFFRYRMFTGWMNSLEEVPFQTLLGSLEGQQQLAAAPDITVPDCHQILEETQVTH